MTAIAWVMLIVGIIVGVGVAWGIAALVDYFEERQEEESMPTPIRWPY